MPYQLGYPGVWWALLDSNQGTPKRPDLQSGGFNHSPKDPHKRLTQVMTIIEMLQATPRVLYTLMVYGEINLHHLIFYLQRDIIGSPCWWAEWESNPHTISDTGF